MMQLEDSLGTLHARNTSSADRHQGCTSPAVQGASQSGLMATCMSCVWSYVLTVTAHIFITPTANAQHVQAGLCRHVSQRCHEKDLPPCT